MRISVIKEDRGYTALAHLLCVTVDGALALAAITADEEAGYAICYVIGEDGTPVLHLDGKSLKTKRVDGQVVIGFHPKAASIMLPEDQKLTPAEFIKKFQPQRDAGKSRAGKAHH